MSRGFIQQVRKAITSLNPDQIRRDAGRRLSVCVQASSPETYDAALNYLAPASMSGGRRKAVLSAVSRAGEGDPSRLHHLVFYEYGMEPPPDWEEGRDAFAFSPGHPERLAHGVLDQRDDLTLPLARLFPPFRDAAARRTIHSISRENALFSLMTALPNVIPSLGSLPWAVGEFASDTAVLTANQVRLAFLLAAANDHAVGYASQRKEIGSIVAGAWGWRTVARQLTGKIPFGGGLLPKAAIAYAGTYVVGLSLDAIYRFGYELTRQERSGAYEAAFEKGRAVASHLLPMLKKHAAAGR
jgi:hypothetical protein